MRVPQSRCWLGSWLHFVAAPQRGLSSPIPNPAASVPVHLSLLLRLLYLGGRLCIWVYCNYGCNYRRPARRRSGNFEKVEAHYTDHRGLWLQADVLLYFAIVPHSVVLLSRTAFSDALYLTGGS
jgi:hypothetical protein